MDFLKDVINKKKELLKTSREAVEQPTHKEQVPTSKVVDKKKVKVPLENPRGPAQALEPVALPQAKQETRDELPKELAEKPTESQTDKEPKAEAEGPSYFQPSSVSDIKIGVVSIQDVLGKELPAAATKSKQQEEVIIPVKPEKKQSLEQETLRPEHAERLQNKRLRAYEDGQRKKGKSEKCKLVYLWCKKMTALWEEQQEEKAESKVTAEVKQESIFLKQTQTDMKPLIKLLKQDKNTTLDLEILDALFILVQHCMMKEYLRANDIYLALCIGNSPWPMGVTMVGIHERSGRSKIFTNQVAHILNDDVTKKYLQGVKRLMSVCQKAFPGEQAANQF